jgi:hypothetical protein
MTRKSSTRLKRDSEKKLDKIAQLQAAIVVLHSRCSILEQFQKDVMSTIMSSSKGQSETKDTVVD